MFAMRTSDEGDFALVMHVRILPNRQGIDLSHIFLLYKHDL